MTRLMNVRNMERLPELFRLRLMACRAFFFAEAMFANFLLPSSFLKARYHADSGVVCQ
jgi:hypothetical protein